MVSLSLSDRKAVTKQTKKKKKQLLVRLLFGTMMLKNGNKIGRGEPIWCANTCPASYSLALFLDMRQEKARTGRDTQKIVMKQIGL